MGGGYYSQDVARQARSTSRDVFSFRGHQQPAGATQAARRTVHPLLDPKGAHRECCNDTPIVVALDVTRSRGDDTKLMYEKLPMFIGQIELKGYVDGPGISFAAIGDATVDDAPLQVGQFEADNRLDTVLSHFWIEEGGGGTGQESYELCAYYYARHSFLRQHEAGGKKGYFFFVGDEGFYPKVDRRHVRKFIGDDLTDDIETAAIFAELARKYHLFFVYPQKSWKQRKKDIDAEIKARVVAAGGRYEGVDIRASLIWNNRNDLDIHVITPEGEEIYYNHKKSRCGGWLDVDMNVMGETTKPVENVQWAKGKARAGHYKVIVQNYAFKEPGHHSTDFRVELEVNGHVEHFDGTVSLKGETGGRSNVTVCEFDYDPAERTHEEPPDKATAYTQYDDKVIKEQWASVIPRDRILLIQDPRSIVDVLLGALAITEGSTDLDGYLEDMKARNQGEERRAQVKSALEGLVSRAADGQVEGSVPEGGGGRPRGGRSKRL